MLSWVALAMTVSVIIVSGFVLTLFLHYKVNQQNKQNPEALFGSTVKAMPSQPPNYSSVSVEIQPSPLLAYPEPELKKTTETETCPEERGLSSSHTKWTSLDMDSAGESGEMRPAPTWRLWLKLHFSAEDKSLSLTLFRAKCYPDGGDSELETRIYCTSYLLPDELSRQTGLYPNTGSPSFDEVFHFPVAPEELCSKSVRCSLYELDPGRTRICLGHTVIRLSELQVLSAGSSEYLQRDLEQLADAMDETYPELHLSLSYHMQTEKLKIQIFTAKNLPDTPAGQQFYMRTHVVLGTRSVKIKKTPLTTTIAGACQANYTFQVPVRHMESCCLQFSVIEVNPAPSDSSGTPVEKVFGQAIIGPCLYAHGSGLQHWKAMLSNPRKSVEMWHKLRRPSSHSSASE